MRIPVMTKQDLINQWDEIVTQPEAETGRCGSFSLRTLRIILLFPRRLRGDYLQQEDDEHAGSFSL